MLIIDEFVKILLGSSNNTDEARLIVEDSESPIRRNVLDKLYSSVESKGHIDFGFIEKSRGDVMAYTGYASMQDTLNALRGIGAENIHASKNFLAQVTTVTTALENLNRYKLQYKQAFARNVTPVMLEYNTFLAACVEATTSLLYNFVDCMRDPSSKEIIPVLKNTGIRGSLFYIEQLHTFNLTCADKSYRTYLDTVINRGTEYFLGIDDAMLVGGVAVVSAVAVSIVPITRKIIYTFMDLRRRLSDELALQAYFLELNQSVIDARSTLSEPKKQEILRKQEELRIRFLRLADKLRVESRRNEELSMKTLDKDNSVLSSTSIREQIDDSDIVLA